MGLVWTQFPPMSGDSSGIAQCSETGAENVTEIVVFGATSCAPGVGVVASRTKLAAERLGLELELGCDEPFAALGEPA